MALCDYAIYNFITSKHYEYLNNLPPVKRAAEIFRLEIETLSVELMDSDEIFGWFTFQDNNYEKRPFADGTPCPDMKNTIDAPALFGAGINVDKAHTVVDYEYILENGLFAYQEKIACELASSPDHEYLLAMKDVLESTKKFVDKMLRAVDKNTNCKNAAEIKKALLQVPFYPARTFREALQSIWIIHFLIPLAENAWYSISLGKFEKYVYPYYQKSISEGMTKAQAKQILHNFYALLNSYSDGSCLLNVGGEEYTEFAKFIIECQRDFAMPAPILGARITLDTPDEIFDMLIDEKLFSMGQPTFYGENSCINALVEKGIPYDTAKNFTNNSCMGIGLAAEEVNSMWGCVFPVSAALEAAVNNGAVLHKDFTIPGISEVTNIDLLYAAFEQAATYLFDICARAYEAKAVHYAQTDPDPFLSILTNGCIQKHCDRISGVKYHNATIECMGMINVADGICAIDKLVFQDKKYTLAQMCAAVKNNFCGYENIKEDIMKCGKFGQNSQADLYAVNVAEILQKVIRRKSHDNIYFCPSLHTLHSNVSAGNSWGAGFDGRSAQAPFAKNAGPSNETRDKAPTSMLLSSAKLPHSKFFGGQPIDINFGADTVKNHKKEIAALIKLYFQKGGLQLQVNSLSSKILKDAIAKPQNYTDLVVRVGGFSTYFNNLSLQARQEFVERVEKEEG